MQSFHTIGNRSERCVARQSGYILLRARSGCASAPLIALGKNGTGLTARSKRPTAYSSRWLEFWRSFISPEFSDMAKLYLYIYIYIYVYLGPAERAHA
jgi:hypothetical protein